MQSQLDQLGHPEGGLRPLDSKAHEAKCIAIAVERHPASVKLQEEVWRVMTGKSRASFLHAKHKHAGEVQPAQTKTHRFQLGDDRTQNATRQNPRRLRHFAAKRQSPIGGGRTLHDKTTRIRNGNIEGCGS